MSRIADTFLLSGRTPSGLHVCPKKLTSLHLNWSFSALNTMPFSCALFMRSIKFRSCSSSVDPYKNMSSVMPVTPLRPSRAVSSCRWKISCDTTKPNGSLETHFVLRCGRFLWLSWMWASFLQRYIFFAKHQSQLQKQENHSLIPHVIQLGNRYSLWGVSLLWGTRLGACYFALAISNRIDLVCACIGLWFHLLFERLPVFR